MSGNDHDLSSGLSQDSPSQRSSSLLAEALLGNRDALGELLTWFVPKVLRRATRSIGSRIRTRQSESDLSQNTHLEALKSFPTFRGTDVASFYCWLSKIASRVIHSCVRRELADRRRVTRDSSNATDNLSVVQPPSGPVRHSELAEILATERGKLPAAQQDVLSLFVEGKSSREIMSELGLTPSAFRGLLYRARQGLRNAPAMEPFKELL